MAYAAVISLKQTINGLLNSSRGISSREILEFAYNEAASLQLVLERLNDSSRSRSSSEGVNALEGQIRDCAHELEDVLELHQSIDEGELRQEITSFAEQARRLEVEFIQELSKQDDEDDATDQYFTANNNIDSDVELLGYFGEIFITIQDHMMNAMRPDDLCFLPLLGEVGSGRTIVAKRIFEDLRNRKNQEHCLFDCSAWVRVGRECELKEVMIRILAQVDNLAAGEYDWLISREDVETISKKQLYKVLEHRRYMLVLDDVHDVQLMEHLRSSCPDRRNGSIVLFTTSSEEISQLSIRRFNFKKHRRYFEENNWFCLRWYCFKNESISAELEEAGRKIVENCRCLQISFAKAYLFLDTREKSVEQWSKIAADKQNPIFMVEDELSEILEIETKLQSTEENEGICGGFYETIERIKMEIHPERFFSKMQILFLMGMVGIGKTTIARKVFKDASIVCHFDHCVWFTLGPKYHTEEILTDILAHIYPTIDRRHIKGDANITRGLCEQLSCKRCLIVLDDLWRKEPLHYLKKLFPDIKGTILVTTRIVKREKFGADDDLFYEMRLLNNEESWYLLREKVFAQGLCPPEFEKVGREIAENCDDLPLLIVTVAVQLLKVEVTLEYWKNVATGKEKSVFTNAHDEISKALLPSYEILPQHLKACFLYIGIFRKKYEIPTSKLNNLLIAEGFHEPNSPQILEAFVGECLSELVDISLVMVQRKVSDVQIKTCRHHSVFWHLSNTLAEKNTFFHAMNSYVDCSIESIKSQRRLCIRNSILLGIKDVYYAMKESSMKLRALLCTGPPHQYQVPLHFGLRLLRVLDALAIRFYEFPIEVVDLIHLRYLGLTFNGKLPSSISKLGKLQYLIVSRPYNTTTRLSENSSLLPVEIWDMKELKHLQVMGGHLPNPKCGDGLRKLSTLLDVSAQSCTKKVLKRIPNLKRLGLRIELAPDDKGNHPFHCLNRISRLGRLESLKCKVINPQISSKVVAPLPPPVSMFPSSLKRLSLSGFGYPWEYMNYIGALRNLQVLKLKRYAFQGPKWEIIGFDFPLRHILESLLLEDTDLVYWIVKGPIFLELRRLSIKHCFKLQELPVCIDIRNLEKLEIVDCSTATVNWVEQMRKMMPDCEVDISQSWLGE